MVAKNYYYIFVGDGLSENAIKSKDEGNPEFARKTLNKRCFKEKY